uniref:Uncharacterized protein n=1 Tax=Oryza sativa subsp. japonica TaxID=39947 RepID=Q2QNU6_ORYSJ|nr:hypothetical protein LOC_Os12g36700 [Oryza sativa Japonica Group]
MAATALTKVRRLLVVGVNDACSARARAERMRAPLADALAEEHSSWVPGLPLPPSVAVPSSSGADSSVEDLLALIYFGSRPSSTSSCRGTPTGAAGAGGCVLAGRRRGGLPPLLR